MSQQKSVAKGVAQGVQSHGFASGQPTLSIGYIGIVFFGDGRGVANDFKNSTRFALSPLSCDSGFAVIACFL